MIQMRTDVPWESCSSSSECMSGSIHGMEIEYLRSSMMSITITKDTAAYFLCTLYYYLPSHSYI